MGDATAIAKVSMNHAKTRRVSDSELRSACMVAHYEAFARELSKDLRLPRLSRVESP